MAEYWLIARESWNPEGMFVAGPWYGRKGKKAAKKRGRDLCLRFRTLTLVKTETRIEVADIPDELWKEWTPDGERLRRDRRRAHSHQSPRC